MFEVIEKIGNVLRVECCKEHFVLEKFCMLQNKWKKEVSEKMISNLYQIGKTKDY